MLKVWMKGFPIHSELDQELKKLIMKKLRNQKEMKLEIISNLFTNYMNFLSHSLVENYKCYYFIFISIRI